MATNMYNIDAKSSQYDDDALINYNSFNFWKNNVDIDDLSDLSDDDDVNIYTPSITIPQAINKQPHRTFRAWKMKGTQYTLIGFSRSADKTFFCIPQLKLCLDGGYCRGRLGNHLFLTHGHFDHSMDICYMCTHNDGMTIYCPNQITKQISDYCQSFSELNLNKTFLDNYTPNFNIDGLNDGDIRYFSPKQKQKSKNPQKSDKYRVTCFKCHHAVPCLGFMFDEKRRKRKNEYKHLDFKFHSKQIRELQKKGLYMTTYYLKLFVYVGDTSIDIFNTSSEILSYPIIIIECTFLNDNDKSDDRLKKDGHIKWNQLKPYVLNYQNITFVLIHFSCKYKEQEIIDFFNKQDKIIQIQTNKQKSLSNCIVWACKRTDGTQKVNL